MTVGSVLASLGRISIDDARELNSSDAERRTLDAWRELALEDWALIRRLGAEGVPKAVIVRRLGTSRTRW